MLFGLLVVSLLFGAIAALAAGDRVKAARAACGTAIALATVIAVGMGSSDNPESLAVSAPWIPGFGATFRLSADPLAAMLCAVVGVVGLVAVVLEEFPTDRPGLYGFSLLACMAAVDGALLSRDLLLFFCFFQAILPPAWALVSIWGREGRDDTPSRFFLVHQAGGLLLLMASATLVVVHQRQTGVWTFDLVALRDTFLVPGLAAALLLGLSAAFLARLAAFPLHSWQPDTLTSLPNGASIVLAVLMPISGTWGLIRVAVPLFPTALPSIAPWLIALGAIGTIYAGILAFSQNELRRLLAWLSISQLGLVVIGAFAWTGTSVRGVVVLVVAHALTTAGWFALAGILERRARGTDLDRLGGLWSAAPRMTFVAVALALASMGSPGFGRFVGALLVVGGAFPQAHFWVSVALLGGVLTGLTTLGVFARAFTGRPANNPVSDLDGVESLVLLSLLSALLLLGVLPQTMLDIVEPAVAAVLQGGAP